MKMAEIHPAQVLAIEEAAAVAEKAAEQNGATERQDCR
jgi:hypothetical protein